jgi:phospholipid/cholesterol/gamma-HCH transport system permease protein
MFWQNLMREMNLIGVDSLLIVVLIALFTGAVTTVQTASQLMVDSGILPPSFFPMSIVGSVVGSSSVLELAPTITCLVLAGKVGANIASEVGNMRISEQLDAYEVMGINSAGFVGLPKIIAGVIMIPCLVIVSNFLLIYGGLWAGKFTGVVTADEFVTGVRSSFMPLYANIMLVKAFIFAFLITSLSVFQGYYTTGGALEVGEAGTKAVTRICVFILFADLIIAKMFL